MLYATQQNGLNKPMVLKHKEIEPQRSAAPVKEAHGSVTFDDLLVAVGKTRNRDAFIRVFEYFAPRVKSFLMKGGLSQEMADELAQETLLTVWQKAQSYDPVKASASTWIFTIARNKRTDFFRQNAKPAPDAEDPSFAGEAPALPDESAINSEENRRLAAAIEKLPAEQARLIREAYFEDKTHADIAAETDIPLGTVKSRIRLALERLRHQMGADDDESD